MCIAVVVTRGGTVLRIRLETGLAWEKFVHSDGYTLN